MNNLKQKLAVFLSGVVLAAGLFSTFAAPMVQAVAIQWDRPAVGRINPLNILDTVYGNQFIGTSTSLANTFPHASTTLLTVGTSLWITPLGTPAGSILAIDPNGKVIATSSTPTGVTSVGISAPSIFTVSGSPVSGSGTLTLTYSGTALPVANGGTGITSFGTGVATWLGTPSSANLASALTDETGSGTAVFSVSPTFTGKAAFANSSTTLASVFSKLYVGGTSTTTIDVAGNIVVPSAASITATGLGTAAGTFLAADASGKFIATTTPSSGGTQWTTSGSNIYNANTGNVGIGTTSPFAKFAMSSQTIQMTTTVTTFNTPGSFTYTNAGCATIAVYMWGGGGAGANSSSAGSGGSGGYVKIASSTVCGNITGVIAQGAQAGTGGTGYASGGTALGGGGGGSTSAVVNGTTHVAAGGGGAIASPGNNGLSSATAASGTSGGSPGSASGVGTAGAGAGATSASGSTPGTGADAVSGVSGDGSIGSFTQSAGGSSAGASGNGTSGSGTTGGPGSGGAAAGANGSAFDSGGGGLVTGTGNGGTPGAGAGCCGSADLGGNGQVTIVATVSAPAYDFFIGTTSQPVFNVTNTGQVTIGTTSISSAAFTVQPTLGFAYTLLQGFIGSTFYAIVQMIDAVGHLRTGGPSPTVNSCSGFSVSGDDRTGTVTMTSGTSCSFTFAKAYSVTPVCSVTPQSAASTVQVTPSTSGISVSFGSSQTQFGYICQYHQN